MNFFNNEDDPFEDILNEFFGRKVTRNSSAGNVIKNENEERIIDYIEEEEFIYFVFELPGFEKKDIEIKVKNNELIINILKKDVKNIKNHLKDKLLTKNSFKKTIPIKIKKDFDYSFNNGILEVKFKRK
ncbi:MAG: Hsp20/alpha crystallin family protein [Nanoarchaeota archaeon]|nr:Hsp20/alpha crystallin family protein [Nanoarchaeota archaeon]